MKKEDYKKEYKWYQDRATFIAFVSGFFSTVITALNALFK